MTNKNNELSGMIPATKFAEQEDINLKEVINKLRDGDYSGRLVNGEWYIYMPQYSKKLSLKEFSSYYLRSLEGNLSSFRNFFLALAIIFFIQGLASIIYTQLINKNAISGFQLIIILVTFIFVIWFSYLGQEYVRLQKEKVENDIYNTITYREESIRMSKEIIENAEKKAENIITIHGDNAVLAIGGSTISGVTQTKTVQGGTELIKSLALLVAYCEQSNIEDAKRYAYQLSEEATKPTPDKGTLFDLWNMISVALPSVTSIVKIAEGVKKLFI